MSRLCSHPPVSAYQPSLQERTTGTCTKTPRFRQDPEIHGCPSSAPQRAPVPTSRLPPLMAPPPSLLTLQVPVPEAIRCSLNFTTEPAQSSSQQPARCLLSFPELVQARQARARNNPLARPRSVTRSPSPRNRPWSRPRRDRVPLMSAQEARNIECGQIAAITSIAPCYFEN